MKKNLADSVSRRLALPPEVISAAPLIQLRGKGNLYIENHGGILEYSDTTVKIAVKGGAVRVWGSELYVCRMTKKCLEIHGRLVGLELE